MANVMSIPRKPATGRARPKLDPLIWRRIQIPAAYSFWDLHVAIQDAMGWLDYHLWEFTLAKRQYGLPMNGDWGTEPRTGGAKVRLREVLRPCRIGHPLRRSCRGRGHAGWCSALAHKPEPLR